MSGSTDRSALEALVAEALEARASGDPDWLEAVLARAPERAVELERALAHLDILPRVAGLRSAELRDRGRRVNDRYVLGTWLGAGAMGVVCEAEDLELGRTVALKRMHVGAAAGAGAERFLKEAEAMAAVDHPNVVQVFDRGATEDGDLYIVMEFLDGAPLDGVLTVVEENPDAVLGRDEGRVLGAFLEDSDQAESSYLRLVVGWARQIAAGLVAAHAAGVVHRDVKPSNVLVLRDGTPVLIDFGVAALQGMATLTRGDTGVGTPAYMAPETVRAGKHRSHAADVYGVCATLYHLVTLRPPYVGSAPEVLAAIQRDDPVPAARLRPGLPRDLQAILDRGMQREPDRRYSTMRELEEDLAAFLEYRPVSVRPVSGLERWGRRAARSKSVRAATLTLVTALVVGGGLWAREGIVARGQVRDANEFTEVYSHLPAAFSLASPSGRAFRDPRDRAALGSKLDRLVELSIEPVSVRLLRASFRWDHGDTEGAVRDMEALAEEVDSPFASGLATAYATAHEGGAAVTPDGLPEPESATDRYLLAYELLRAGRYMEAKSLLEEPDVRAIDHAEELHLNFAASATQGPEDAARTIDEIERLEARLGGRTAMTGQLRTMTLVLAGRADEALFAAERAVDLAPRSSSVRTNAALAAYEAGRHRRALEHVQVAVELRPDHFKPYRTGFYAHLALREVEEARALLADAPLAPALRTYLEGLALTEVALRAWVEGDHERARELAIEGHGLGANHRASPGFVPDLHDALQVELMQEDGRPFRRVAEYLVEHPRHWQQQVLLLELFPDVLDASESAALKALFTEVVEMMAVRTGELAPSPLSDSDSDSPETTPQKR